ncbi:MAG: 50S ribosomal protein L1 [Candidatus Bathyarchaeia archaeon]
MPLARENLLSAIEAVRESGKRVNFVQSIELAIVLRGIDPKKTEDRVRLDVELPHGIVGRERRVCVFADGEFASRAKQAGADRVIGREEITAMAADKKAVKTLAGQYDFFLAEGSLMPEIAKSMGRFLGPRDKMPRPVSPSEPLERVIASQRRTVRVRTKDQPVIRCVIGTEKMSGEDISDNVLFVLEKVIEKLRRRENNVRGVYLKKTMGKAIRVAL